MRRPHSRLAAAAVLTLSLGGLVGCGGGDESGDSDDSSTSAASDSASADSSESAETSQAPDTSAFTDQDAEKILDDGLDAMKQANSLRLAGTLTTDSQELTLDIALDDTGNCAGTISAGDGQAQVINTGGQAYLKADEAFYAVATGDPNAAKTISTVVGDKWVTGTPDDSFADICDLDDFLDELDPEDSTLTKGEVSDLDGQEVIEIQNQSKDDDGGASIYISTAEPHYALKAEKAQGDEPGTVTFSDFDEPVDATAPAASDTIDFSKLQGAGQG